MSLNEKHHRTPVYGIGIGTGPNPLPKMDIFKPDPMTPEKTTWLIAGVAVVAVVKVQMFDHGLVPVVLIAFTRHI